MMRRIIAKFLRDLGGQIALSAALTMGGVTVMVAMSLNLNANVSLSQDLQAIADETALTLAVEINVLKQSGVDLNSVALARVNATLTNRGRDALTAANVSAQSVRVEPIPPGTPSADVQDDAVEVSIEVTPTPSPALSALNATPKPVRVSSRALRLGSSNLCIIALNDTEPNTMLARDSARLTAPNCDIVSNSTDPEGMNVANAARLLAAEIHSAGGARGQPTAFTPDPVTDSLSLPDPLINIAEPDTTTCTAVPNPGQMGKQATLSPTVFCDGLKINGNREVFLQPGVYTFMGDLDIRQNGTLRGDGVTIHIAGGNGRFMARSGSTVRLSAPETGATAGILLFESRSNAQGNVHLVETDDARYLLGTIYVPQGIFRVNTSSAVSDQSEYTAIIARELQLHDAANLYLNTDYDATNVPTPNGVGPIDEGVRLVH
ncbi:MAG: hypothetical protein AAF216_05360 [Pseudomonadota bacterium]